MPERDPRRDPRKGDVLRGIDVEYHVTHTEGEYSALEERFTTLLVYYTVSDGRSELSLSLNTWRILRKGCTVVARG